MNLDHLLSIALEASLKASKAILNVKNDFKVWQKDDFSPLSSADLASNETLIEILSRSDIPICSEEKPISYDERKHLKRFWLIDPLDGTKGFIKGSDEYCILIALIEDQRPILSIIKQPSTDECFYAHKESKVYKNDTLLQKDESAFKASEKTALVSVHHPNEKNQAFLDQNALETIKISSALKFKLLLEGKAGIYHRFESLHSWDIAAGDFLVNQNEGLMCDFNHMPLLYNQKSFLCPAFIALSKKENFHNTIL